MCATVNGLLSPLTFTLYRIEFPSCVNVAVPEGDVPANEGGGTSFVASSVARNVSGADLVAGAEAQARSASGNNMAAVRFMGPPGLQGAAACTRRGRRTSSPPQFGHFSRIASAHRGQNVHS
jgi:hypothetical protein